MKRTIAQLKALGFTVEPTGVHCTKLSHSRLFWDYNPKFVTSADHLFGDSASLFCAKVDPVDHTFSIVVTIEFLNDDQEFPLSLLFEEERLALLNQWQRVYEEQERLEAARRAYTDQTQALTDLFNRL